jgi:transcriptional regulator with GAF, ATPase, and Fis domain
VIERFADLLLTALGLDLVYVRVDDPNGGSSVETARAEGRDYAGSRAAAIGTVLAPCLDAMGRGEVESPVGGGKLRLFAVALAATSPSLIVAGSRRVDFPTDLDALLLKDAVNQAETWLRMAQMQSEPARSLAPLATARRQDSIEPEHAYIQEKLQLAHSNGGIVGKSRALGDILSQVALVARTDATVLLLGESGTGKELLAREIHGRSRRATRPLVKVNCSAIPREMFESEFFGHVRGAYTGALRDRSGRFEMAQKGTIFLDEIGDMPLDLQPKLLRVLQEGQYERVGDDATRKVDIRVIAATNRDLRVDVRAGRFREDLYYRLSVFPIEVPPLRARKEDIAVLAGYFVVRAAKQLGVPTPSISERAVESMKQYDWPGNVRELQNVIGRAVILAQGGELRIDSILAGSETGAPASSSPADEIVPDAEWRRRERANLVAALSRAQGRIYGHGGAAELLGVKPSTLQSRLRAMSVSASDWRGARAPDVRMASGSRTRF